MSTKYYRICRSKNDFGELVSTQSYRDVIEYPRETYRSLCIYESEHLDRFLEKGSVAGIVDLKTDRLVFDIDNGNDLDKAKSDAVTLVDRLVKEGFDSGSIQIFFSGKKGFTVQVELEEAIELKKMKAAALKLGSDLSIDTQIYNYNRIFREPLTLHPDSKLYKIPLAIDEFEALSVSDIMQQAKTTNGIPHDFYTFYTKAKLPESLQTHVDSQEKKEITNKVIATAGDLDLTKKPKIFPPCKYALMQGYFKEGGRNNAMIIIAATCRAAGFDKEQTYYMMKAAQEKAHERYGSEAPLFDKDYLWQQVEQVFSDTWNGGQYSCKTSEYLQSVCASLGLRGNNQCKQNDSSDEIRSVGSILPKFVDYVKNLDKNTIKTGIPEIDRALFLSTGCNLGIVGSPASGKSAISLQILNNTSKQGIRSVFASLDMKDTRMFEKIMYRLTGMSRDQVYKMAVEQPEKVNELVQREFGKVNFYDKSMSTVSELREYIIRCNEQSKDPSDKVKLVVVDYFERLFSDVSDDTAASKRLAGELQDLVNDLDICLITLVQPRKIAGTVDAPITSYTDIKGSSFLAQSFRIIGSIYREGYDPMHPENDKFLTFNILKNDLGELASLDFSWNGKRGHIGQLTEDDREMLAEIRAAKALSNNRDQW